MKVTYVEHMGSDLLVANAARKSFGAGYDTFRTREMGPRRPGQRSDEELIEDLAASGHMLPFRHPHVVLECDAPLPIARQLGKHQVGLEWSEISRRYKKSGLTFWRLNDQWRADVEDRRQGSGDLLPADKQKALAAIQERNVYQCLDDFEEALDLGASLEQARFLLPQSMMVSWTWTGSLLAFAHLHKMRNHPDTQAETRDFARQCSEIIAPLFPVSWRALTC